MTEETVTPARPLSPHLSVWKWGPGMTTSIAHRVLGSGMALVGSILLVWWLAALATGPAYYAQFVDVFTYKAGTLNAAGWIVGVGLTFALFQHLASGVRHLVMDVGANFELQANKTTAWLTLAFSLVATILFWVVIWEKVKG